MFADFDDPSGQYFSENIEESPMKKDKRISNDKNLKIPEFPYNENNIKSVQRVSQYMQFIKYHGLIGV